MKELKNFFWFLLIWIAGCAIADYVFQFESRAFNMAWGYIVGSLGFLIADNLSPAAKQSKDYEAK